MLAANLATLPAAFQVGLEDLHGMQGGLNGHGLTVPATQ